MNLKEKLAEVMGRQIEEHQSIEQLAGEILADLGFHGASGKHCVLKRHEQQLSVSYSAHSQMVLSDGENTGLRVVFRVQTSGSSSFEVAAFFRMNPRIDLDSVKVIKHTRIEELSQLQMLEGLMAATYPHQSITDASPADKGKASREAMAQFVEKSSALLCRVYFK